VATDEHPGVGKFDGEAGAHFAELPIQQARGEFPGGFAFARDGGPVSKMGGDGIKILT
jgi:hypothetical protein